jgi:hypothetical protein
MGAAKNFAQVLDEVLKKDPVFRGESPVFTYENQNSQSENDCLSTDFKTQEGRKSHHSPYVFDNISPFQRRKVTNQDVNKYRRGIEQHGNDSSKSGSTKTNSARKPAQFQEAKPQPPKPKERTFNLLSNPQALLAAKILGVSADCLTASQVKHGYRKTMKSLHPDQNPNATTKDFMAARQAYKILEQLISG